MFFFLLRLAVTATLLLLLIRGIEYENIFAAARSIGPGLLVLCLFLQLLGTSIAAYRWHLIMAAIGQRRPFPFHLHSYFKGAFFNQALPTSIGGDAIRILDCNQAGTRTMDAFSGVFIDRIAGLAGLLLLNLAGLTLFPPQIPQSVFHILLLIVVLSGASIFLFCRLDRLPLLNRLPWLGSLNSLARSCRQVYASHGTTGLQTGLSLIIHLLTIIIFYILGRGSGLPFPFTVYLSLVPPVILLTILPVSLAGWGVREGGLVGLFLLVGAQRPQVLACSLLYGMIVLTGALPGVWVYLHQKTPYRDLP